jgi:hypothetical protein
MNRSQCALAFGACGGLFRTRRPASAETVSKASVNWAAAVPDQEPGALGARVGVHEDVASGRGGPRAGRVGGHPEQVGTAAAVFEHDQGVDAFEVDGVDVQEVDRDRCGRL